MAIHVLMLLTNLQAANGVASYAIESFSSIDKDKIKIDFALFDGSRINPRFLEIINKTDSKVIIIPPLTKLFAHVKECKRILRANSYDIIHDTSLMASLVMMSVAKKNRLPVRILHSHSSKLSGNQLKEKINTILLPYLVNCGNVFFACSEIAGRTMFGRKEFTVVPNIVNDKRFTYNETQRTLIRQKNNVSPNKMVVGTVGRLSFEKNPLFVLQIVQVLKNMVTDFEYWWVGTGPLEEEFRQRIHELQLESHVKLLGEQAEIEAYYNALDCLIIPSYFEGFGLCVVEGQACGLPCIVSDSIPIETQISDLVTRLNIENDSASVWAEKTIAETKTKRDRRNYNRNLVDSDFSPKKSGKVLEELYVKCLVEKGCKE